MASLEAASVCAWSRARGVFCLCVEGGEGGGGGVSRRLYIARTLVEERSNARRADICITAAGP